LLYQLRSVSLHFKSKNMEKQRLIEICQQIADDAKKDVEEFEGKPFTGKVVGEYMGYHAASIAALANILKKVLLEGEN
jgi:hypothetical protein